jgi:predicted kinase
MATLYIMRGLPGSGKTTKAKEIMVAHDPRRPIKRVNRDELRVMLDDGKHSKEREKFVKRIEEDVIGESLWGGIDVIVDDTNLSPKTLEWLNNLAKTVHAKVEVVDLTSVPPEECIRHDMKRENSVGSKVIWRMYHQFVRKPIDPPIENLNLPQAIICDIDGTLALHNRDPFDFDKLDTDVVNPAVERILRWANDRIAGPKILLVTGRENKYVGSTQNWLNKNGIKYDLLLMRATDDTQRDDIVKQEIYEQHIKNRYRILFVLDDRDRVVAFWRSLGVVCLQVADGSF